MGVHYGGKDLTFKAGEDLSGHQYRFVVQSDDNTVRMADSATEIAVGILQNDPANNESAVVRVDGTSKLVANAAIAVGKLIKNEYVGAADNGKADEIAAEGDNIRGLVIEASGAEDDLCGVILTIGIHAISGAA